jgi:hypothetical protein
LIHSQVRARPLGALSASVAGLTSGRAQELGREIEAKIAPIRSDVQAMNSQIVQLQDVRTSLEKVGALLRDTSGFFADSVSARRLIQGLQGQVHGHEARLKHLQGRRDIQWSRGIALVSSIIALGSAALLCYSTFLR